MPTILTGPPGVYVATFVYCFASGIVPFLNSEAYLLSLSAFSPGTALFPVVVAASLGQMSAKGLLYLAGGGLLRLPLRRHGGRMQDAAVCLAGAQGRATTLLLVSAVCGIPPFYAMSVAAGLLRFPFRRFLVVGTLGRLLRFAAVFVLPRLLHW